MIVSLISAFVNQKLCAKSEATTNCLSNRVLNPVDNLLVVVFSFNGGRSE